MRVCVCLLLLFECVCGHELGTTPEEVCQSLDDGAWPGITCYKPSGKLISKAGSFGALIAVELKNDGRNFDIYVNCPLHPEYAKNDYKGIEVDCGPDDLVKPQDRSTVLIFWKNAKEELMMAEEYMAAHHFQVGPLRKEVIRGRLIARAGVGPDVFEVTMPGNRETRHPIMIDSTTAELLPFTTFGDSTRDMSGNSNRILKRAQQSMTAILNAPRDQMTEINLRQAFDRHLMTVAWVQATNLGMLWSRAVWAHKLFARGYLHCDAHSGNVMMPKFNLNLNNQTERKAFDQMIKKGLVYMPEFGDMPTVPLEIDTDGSEGVREVVFVSPQHWLMIDPAYIITLRELILDKGIPIEDIVNPCLVQRQARVEDAVHLWHVILRRLDSLSAIKTIPIHEGGLREKLRLMDMSTMGSLFEREMMEYVPILRFEDLMFIGLRVDSIVNCGAQGLEYFRKIQHRGRFSVNVTREVYKDELFDDMPQCSARDYIRLSYTLVKWLHSQSLKLRQTTGWQLLQQNHNFQILDLPYQIGDEKTDLSTLVNLKDIDQLVS